MDTLATRRWEPLAWPLDRSFENLIRWPRDLDQGEFVPSLDLREMEDAFILNAELPGMKREDITVTCENGLLRISGEKRLETEQKTGNFHKTERRFGRFTREIYLGSEADIDLAEAQFRDGVLSIRLPKVEAAKPKRIELT